MIKRNAIAHLLEWKKQKNKKPLIIRGARQIGKTTLSQSIFKKLRPLPIL